MQKEKLQINFFWINFPRKRLVEVRTSGETGLGNSNPFSSFCLAFSILSTFNSDVCELGEKLCKLWGDEGRSLTAEAWVDGIR